MSSNKLQVGVIGAGGISALHLQRLTARSDAVRLVALADINEQKAQTAAEKYGIERRTADYRDFLPDVDAMLICVPTHLHASIAIECLEAGTAVFCEKPLARTLEEAEAIEKTAKHTGTPLQVGFVRRFDEDWLSFREVVQAGKIGNPVMWRQVMAANRPQAAWYNVEEIGGGPFLDGSVHTVDFALHTFGPAEWVFAHLRTLDSSLTALDAGTATIRFASGDELMMAWSWGSPPGCSTGSVFELLGPQGTITWPLDEPEHAARRRLVINYGQSSEEVSFPMDSVAQAFNKQMDEFIEVANRRSEPRAGVQEGREALRLCLAILESGRTQKLVHM